MEINRYCYKCADCIAVFFVEPDANTLIDLGVREFGATTPTMECACGGVAKLMGRVHRKSIIETGVKSACDERCTSAAGCNCDCMCGGVNHGTGAIVPYFKDVSNKIPKAHNQPNLEVANEWRGALLDAEARMQIKYGSANVSRFRARQHISSYDMWCNINDDMKTIKQAKEGKLHKNRMAKLATIAVLTDEQLRAQHANKYL